MKKVSSQLKIELGIALTISIIIIVLVIMTTDSSPQWIYQGF